VLRDTTSRRACVRLFGLWRICFLPDSESGDSVSLTRSSRSRLFVTSLLNFIQRSAGGGGLRG